LRGKQAVQVTSINAGSAGEQAGLRVGDLVFQIAGKRWKDTAGYLDATAKAADAETYEVQAMRGGKLVKLTRPRAFRPAVVAPAATVDEVPASTAILPEQAPALLADELGKLAALRDTGILTKA
jgi:C-terminal processing protease CtpA/Prc